MYSLLQPALRKQGYGVLCYSWLNCALQCVVVVVVFEVRHKALNTVTVLAVACKCVSSTTVTSMA